MWLLLLFFTTYTIIYLIQIEISRLKFNYKFKHIVSSREYPIIGSSFTVRCTKPKEFLKISKMLCPTPISKFTALGHRIFAISDPAVTQKVMLSPVFHKRSDTTRFFEMENALFTSNYENWKPIRKPLNMAFGKQTIIAMVPSMNSHIDTLIRKIETHLNDENFNIYTPIAQFDVEQIFGMNFH